MSVIVPFEEVSTEDFTIFMAFKNKPQAGWFDFKGGIVFQDSRNSPVLKENYQHFRFLFPGNKNNAGYGSGGVERHWSDPVPTGCQPSLPF